MANPDIKIGKVTLNIGVGDSGDKLQKAEKLLTVLTGQKPLRTFGKKTISEWGVRKFAPIGVKVTLRHKKAADFLGKAFEAIEHKVKPGQFDSRGNLSFGIREYIELPQSKYDPDIGMFGFDLSVNLERSGYRVTRRAIRPAKIPKKAIITPEESAKFFEQNFKVKVVTE